MMKPTTIAALMIATASAIALADHHEGGEKHDEHPDTKSEAWKPLFSKDLSNAKFPAGIWTRDGDGVLTASEDQAIWSEKKYKDFVLDLEFKTADDTNSGVIVHCSDRQDWIPNSIEIQIADDHSEQWSSADKTWQCAAIFGRLAAKKSLVKKPGEWNHYTITCKGKMIYVVLNGELVTEMDMSKWTDPKKNPDGSEIPGWLSKPAASLPLEGNIGLQGKHAGAPIYFRKIKIKELEK
jgi:hypothetical protein